MQSNLSRASPVLCYAVALAKARKQAAAPEPPPLPQVGDKVIPEGSEVTYVITGIRSGGAYVDLELPGTYLTRFHVDVATLKFVDRVPPKPVKSGPDPDDLIERIGAVQRENLQRLDDDFAILAKYLKTKSAPKAAIEAIETLRSDQRKAWSTAVEKIENLLK